VPRSCWRARRAALPLVLLLSHQKRVSLLLSVCFPSINSLRTHPTLLSLRPIHCHPSHHTGCQAGRGRLRQRGRPPPTGRVDANGGARVGGGRLSAAVQSGCQPARIACVQRVFAHGALGGAGMDGCGGRRGRLSVRVSLASSTSSLTVHWGAPHGWVCGPRAGGSACCHKWAPARARRLRPVPLCSRRGIICTAR